MTNPSKPDDHDRRKNGNEADPAPKPQNAGSESWARAAAEAILDSAGVETLGFPSCCDEEDTKDKVPRGE